MNVNIAGYPENAEIIATLAGQLRSGRRSARPGT